MKLGASVMVGAGEFDRYLEICLSALLEFCDEISIRCEADRGSQERDYLWNLHSDRVRVLCNESSFFKNEGRARQELLDWTLQGGPDFVIAIDADELVSDGLAVRRACEQGRDAYGLTMFECWEASEERLCIRVDGGWAPTRVPALWRVPNQTHGLRIADRALACGRVPTSVDRRGAFAIDADLIHYGWTNESERIARHHRYAVADGGRFHRSAHLDSILFGCDRVKLEGMDWPAGLLPYRDAILARVKSGVSPSAVE